MPGDVEQRLALRRQPALGQGRAGRTSVVGGQKGVARRSEVNGPRDDGALLRGQGCGCGRAADVPDDGGAEGKRHSRQSHKKFHGSSVALCGFRLGSK